MSLTSRLASRDDLAALAPLVEAAIDELQKGFLEDAQIKASHAIMGVDTELIDDQTYFIVECDGQIAGCGGWSRRATLYGGSHSAGRDSALLDPSKDPARVRAMYTHPTFTRRGVGRLILSRCESAAAAEGFSRIELMATRSGQPLYEAAGRGGRIRGHRRGRGLLGRSAGSAHQDGQAHHAGAFREHTADLSDGYVGTDQIDVRFAAPCRRGTSG
jgi:GNAT superfamily N-acetyltransferase